MFGQTAYDASAEHDTTPIVEQLGAFADLIQAGKIRHLGLSNETPWGVSAFTRAADEAGLPRVASIQNAYNLLNRVFE
jgi:Predicted oxidoreductases (related to aryl-alcohol dehydrogenases)